MAIKHGYRLHPAFKDLKRNMFRVNYFLLLIALTHPRINASAHTITESQQGADRQSFAASSDFISKSSKVNTPS